MTPWVTLSQYNESDFDFIRRLAWKYKEWLYYDGTRLVFGKPELPDAVGLEFERNLISFETGGADACASRQGILVRLEG